MFGLFVFDAGVCWLAVLGRWLEFQCFGFLCGFCLGLGHGGALRLVLFGACVLIALRLYSLQWYLCKVRFACLVEIWCFSSLGG